METVASKTVESRECPLDLLLSLVFCFFSRACDYVQFARTRSFVGDRDEGWVVCRDGIAGAPLIYPFTHQPCLEPGSIVQGAPTLFTRHRQGPLFCSLLSSLFRPSSLSRCPMLPLPLLCPLSRTPTRHDAFPSSSLGQDTAIPRLSSVDSSLTRPTPCVRRAGAKRTIETPIDLPQIFKHRVGNRGRRTSSRRVRWRFRVQARLRAGVGLEGDAEPSGAPDAEGFLSFCCIGDGSRSGWIRRFR